jgi:hypothetical protein
VRRAQVLMWGIGIPFALLVVTSLVAIVLTASGYRIGMLDIVASLTCVFGLCALALMIFVITYLLFLEKLRLHLGINADIARRTWGPQVAPPN